MKKTTDKMLTRVNKRFRFVMESAAVITACLFISQEAEAGTGQVTIQNQSGSTIYARWKANGVSQQTPTITAGSTFTSSVLVSGYNGNTITVDWSFTPGVFTYAGEPSAGYVYSYAGATTMPFTAGNIPGPDTNVCTITLCIRNNDNRYRVYGLFKGATQYTPSGYPGGMGVGAGQTGCMTFTDWCTNSAGYYLDLYPGESGTGQPVTNSVVVTNGPASYPSSTNAYTPNSPVYYNPTNTGTGTNILWTQTSSTNVIISQQQGDSAIHDAINKFAQGNDINLRSINTNLSGLGTINRSGFNGISNMLGVLHGLTNGSGTDTGVVAAVDRFHLDNTNLLRQIRDAILINTNKDGDISILTNLWQIPDTAEHAEFESHMADLQIGNLDPSIPETDDSFWTVTLIPGVTPFNFRPSHHLGSVAELMHKMVLWGAVLAYCLFVLKDIFELFKLIATTQQLDAPEAEATILGVGGNWGILLAPLVVSIFLGLWALFLETVITSMGTVLGGVDFVQLLASSPFAGVTGSVAHGVGEASQWLPLGFLVSSAVAYVAWYASKNIMAAKVTFIIKMIIH